jgi:hypothetical protein
MHTHCWIAHAVPGRVWLRVAAGAAGQLDSEALQEKLRAAPGVEQVEYRPEPSRSRADMAADG